ncbi:probable protein phosphatase 2C 13, partial [Olea europaea var. sylvestris]
MVAEREIFCRQSVSVKYLSAEKSTNIEAEFFDVSSAAVAVDTPGITTTTPPRSQICCASESEISIEICRSESARSCSTSGHITTVFESPSSKFVPSICSGSHSDIGPRCSNEDEHIRIDDLSAHLGSLYKWSQPSAFYAVFDGHGGSDAAAYVKNNAMKFFFEDAILPQTSDNDEKFLQDLVRAHRKAFSLIDLALADEQNSVDSYCGTTAITALVLGRHLLISNVGDCRAVLCRKGVAVQLSHDHRPSCQLERRRVEDLG